MKQTVVTKVEHETNSDGHLPFVLLIWHGRREQLFNVKTVPLGMLSLLVAFLKKSSNESFIQMAVQPAS